MLQILFNI